MGGFEPPSYRDIPYTIFQLKVHCSICFVGMVRYHQFESHAYRRILLSVSSRAANYAPHRLTMLHGGLSATSPAHHRMAINHLLHRLIYNAILMARCHTLTESMITTQRVVDALICLIIL